MTIGPAARIDPAHAHPSGVSCPTVRPVATVVRYGAEYLPGDSREPSYLVTVVGTVANHSRHGAVVASAVVRIRLPGGGVHDTPVPSLAGARLGPGASNHWAMADVATGLKQATVLSLIYRWEDPSLSRCPL